MDLWYDSIDSIDRFRYVLACSCIHGYVESSHVNVHLDGRGGSWPLIFTRFDLIRSDHVYLRGVSSLPITRYCRPYMFPI